MTEDDKKVRDYLLQLKERDPAQYGREKKKHKIAYLREIGVVEPLPKKEKVYRRNSRMFYSVEELLEKNFDEQHFDEIVMEQIDEAPDGCWYLRNRMEYETTNPAFTFNNNKNSIQIRRAMFILFNGEIDAGMYVDTTCGERYCVNPDHMTQARLGEIVSKRRGL